MPKEHERGSVALDRKHRLPPVSEDMNIKAYKRELPRLLRDHESEFVAFAEGELIDINADRDELLKLAQCMHPGKAILITRIQRKPRRNRLLSPRKRLQPEHLSQPTFLVDQSIFAEPQE